MVILDTGRSIPNAGPTSHAPAAPAISAVVIRIWKSLCLHGSKNVENCKKLAISSKFAQICINESQKNTQNERF
jgi:hypothetical protein